MPKQPPAAGLVTAWYRDEFNEALAHGDPVGTVHDYSGDQGDLVQATGANQPEFETKVRWGRPAYRFGRAAGVHFMTGPDCDLLVNDAQGTVFVSFYITSIASEQILFTDGAAISLRIMPTGVMRAQNLSGGVDNADIGNDPDDLFQLTLNQWHVGIWEHSGGFIYGYLDDPLFYERTSSGNTGARGLLRVGASGAGADPLLDAYIGEIIFYSAGLNDTNRSQVFGYMANGWLDRGDPLARKRDAGSRRLDKKERSRGRHRIHVPDSFLGSAELYTPHAISHPALPRAGGSGAGIRRWERGIVTPVSRRWDLDRDLLELSIEEKLSIQYRETGIATRSADPRREGVKISGVGPYRFPIVGTTPAWVESAGGGLIVEVAAGVEAAEADGMVCEPQMNQYLLRTSFISQLAGLTTSGTGVNGSAIVADPTSDLTKPTLFHTDVTGFCALFTGGNPHSADLYLQWPLTTGDELIQADSRGCLTLDTCDFGPGTDPLNWWGQNTFDSTWWDDANETWSASPVPNDALFLLLGGNRHRSNVIRFPAGGTCQFLLRVGYKSGGTASRQARLFHVQLESTPFPTGRVVQDATFLGSPTRSARSLGFQEWDNRLFFNEPRGTFGFVITPPWSAEDLEAGTHTIPGGLAPLLCIIQYLNPATDHYWAVRFNGSLGAGNSRFEWVAKAGGAEQIAYHTNQPARFEQRAVVVRWTSSSEGELDLPANTLSIFVGSDAAAMTKGTDISGITRPTPISGGGRVQWNVLGSRLKHIWSTAEVLSDEEIVAWWEELRAAL